MLRIAGYTAVMSSIADMELIAMDITSKIDTSHYNEETHGPAIFATTTLAPGATEDLVVGVYEDCIPEPKVHMEFSTASSGGVEASLVRHQEFGDYTLVCHMSNKGPSPLSVIIRNMGAGHAYHQAA